MRVSDSTRPAGQTAGIVAARLGIDRAWLLAEASAGRIPSIPGGREPRFILRDVVHTLATRRPTDDGGHVA
jgi:hypothetical protein